MSGEKKQGTLHDEGTFQCQLTSLHWNSPLTHLCSSCRYASTRSIVTGFAATFFPIFDVPVFWPILLLYWIVLFTVTMKRQIQHMVKYRYIPFSFGKKKYTARSGKPVKNSN